MTDKHPANEGELVELVRSIDVPAPDSLHRHVEELLMARGRRGMRGSARARTNGRHSAPAAGRPLFAPRAAALGAIALAALAVVLTVALSGGGKARFSVRETSALSLRPATSPAPDQNTADRAELTAAVDGVAFPYWEDRFGWRATGMRTDELGGRTVTTVFYSDAHGQRIGYAIVAGLPAPAVSGGSVAWRDHRAFRVLREDGTQVVSWLRGGHMCVVTGAGVSSATLLRLASWNARSGQAA